MIKTENFEQLQIESAEELNLWLTKNHSQKESIWLVTFKKTEKDKYVSRDEVLDELLSFGWIDGIRRKLDAHRTMQLVSPRRIQHWSKTYKERASKLIANKKMQKAGFESIKKGKESGLWDFMNDVDNLSIPKDLESKLKSVEGAFDFFNNINNSSKRFALRWLKLSKTEKTRTQRIEKLTHLAMQGEKLPGS